MVLPVAAALADAPRPVREVSGGLTTSHGHTSNEQGAERLVPASHGTPVVGFSGLRLGTDLALAPLAGGWLGVVAQADLRLEFVAYDTSRETSLQRDLAVGARWRPEWEVAVVPEATLAFATVSAVAFRGLGDEVFAFTVARYGVQPGVGVTFPVGPLALRTDTALLFAPGPVEWGLGAHVDLPEVLSLVPRVGLDVDHRGWRVDEARLRQTRVVLDAGVVASF